MSQEYQRIPKGDNGYPLCKNCGKEVSRPRLCYCTKDCRRAFIHKNYRTLDVVPEQSRIPREKYVSLIMEHQSYISWYLGVRLWWNTRDVKDLVQETIKVLLECWDTYDGREFKRYARAKINLVYAKYKKEFLRYNHKRVVSHTDYLDANNYKTTVIAKDTSNTTDIVDYSIIEDALPEVLSLVIGWWGEAFLLKYFGDYDDREIAQRLGKPEASVRVALFKMVKIVRRAVGVNINAYRRKEKRGCKIKRGEYDHIRELVASGRPMVDVAKEYGVSRHSIGKIIHIR